MTRRRAIIVVILAGAVVSVAAAVTAWISVPQRTAQLVSDRYQALVNQLEGNGVWIRHRELTQRSPTHAQAVTRLSLPAAWLTPRWRQYELEITTQFDYGWRWNDWQQWPPLRVQALSRWRLLGAGRELPPLRTEVTLNWAGELTAELRSPFVTYNGAPLVVQVTDGRGKLRWSQQPPQPSEAWLELAAVQVATPDQRGVWLRDLRVQLRWDDQLQALVTLNGLAIEGLGGISTMQWSNLAVELTTSASPAAPLSADSATRALPPMADLPQSQGAIQLNVTLDSLTVPESTYHPLRFQAKLSGVDLNAPLLSTAMTDSQPVTWQMALRRWLASGRPKLQVEPFTIGSVYGEMRANVDLSVSDPQLDRNAPVQWASHLTGSGRITMPPPLLQVWLEMWQRRRVQAELAQRGEPIAPLPLVLERELTNTAKTALVGLVHDGWLVPSGAGLAAVVTFDQGQVRVNYHRLQALNPSAVFALPSPATSVTP
ncbi:DUF945 family protein [Thiospirillum jenense]|uniref:DUF945 family protein n=1 Tax=Thiospirillum jenense TaxID=1653858 RepID=A0A839HH90_9GAMM|nr:DUF945 family protein [Thiospirillum jenense]MBB1126219.1 DUF945 family protein [Thiospirillum jenense]